MSDPIGPGAKFIRLIVKNDAVKADPHQIYGWRAFAMAGSACFGGYVFGGIYLVNESIVMDKLN
jgi:hypothetical protein